MGRRGGKLRGGRPASAMPPISKEWATMSGEWRGGLTIGPTEGADTKICTQVIVGCAMRCSRKPTRIA